MESKNCMSDSIVGWCGRDGRAPTGLAARERASECAKLLPDDVAKRGSREGYRLFFSHSHKDRWIAKQCVRARHEITLSTDAVAHASACCGELQLAISGRPPNRGLKPTAAR